ncbi:unnamed protein product, partial [marine sediment metagenome]
LILKVSQKKFQTYSLNTLFNNNLTVVFYYTIKISAGVHFI